MNRERAMRDVGCPACGAPLDRLPPATDPAWPGRCARCDVRLYYLRPGQHPPPAFRTWDAARQLLLDRRRIAHEWRLLRAVASAERDGPPRRAIVRSRGAVPDDPPAGEPCAVCSADDGQAFDVADALDRMPLPHHGCTCRWPDGMEGVCGCEWVVEEGQLTGAAG